MSRISRTLRMLMPNVSPARPSVRYCAVSAMLLSPKASKELYRQCSPVRAAPPLCPALKIGVAIVLGVFLGECQPAGARRLGGPRRLGSDPLPPASIGGGHACSRRLELADGAVDRCGFRSRRSVFNPEVGDGRLKLFGLRGKLLRRR